ncbi:MAG: DUF4410 domain-containing protein [Candidatus Zixiibacteriota bacterium]|nr:MAG: DUF4410 domain-containing protein [candidate division Zixibacteria bacterium]
MVRFLILILAVVVVCGAVIGCAGGSSITALHPMERAIAPNSTLYFSAQSVIAEDVQAEMVKLEAEVSSKLLEAAVFKAVYLGACTDSCENTLNIHGVITDIHKVTGEQRFFAGAFAGKARLNVDLIICDAVSGDTLGVYEVEGKSGGTGLAGGTGTAIDRAATQIAELLQGHVSQ